MTLVFVLLALLAGSSHPQHMMFNPLAELDTTRVVYSEVVVDGGADVRGYVGWRGAQE